MNMKIKKITGMIFIFLISLTCLSTVYASDNINETFNVDENSIKIDSEINIGDNSLETDSPEDETSDDNTDDIITDAPDDNIGEDTDNNTDDAGSNTNDDTDRNNGETNDNNTEEGNIKIQPEFFIDSFEFEAGFEPMTIEIRTNDDATGNITFTLCGKNYTSKVENGIAKVNVSGFDGVGAYETIVYYSGDSKYESKEFNLHIVVRPVLDLDVYLTVKNTDVYTIVTVHLSRNFNVGELHAVGDLPLGHVIEFDGKFEYDLYCPVVNPGKYDWNFYIFLSKSHGYADWECGFTVEIFKSDIDVKNIVYGETAVITEIVDPNMTGNLTFVVDGKNYTPEIINGRASVSIDGLNPGNYTVSVIYDKGYYNIENSAMFNVAKANSNIDINVDDIVYGDDATIIANVGLTGNVTFILNNENYTVDIINGSASINLTGLNAGNYEVIAIYNGNNYYNKSTTNKTFNVYKLPVDFQVSVNNVVYGEDIIILVNVVQNVSRYVEFMIIKDDNQVYTKLINITNNNISIAVSGLSVGEYYILALIHVNDTNYDSNENEAYFNVSKANPIINITADDIIFGEDGLIIASVPEYVTGNITFIIDNKQYTAKIINNTANITVSGLNAGKYTITASINGNENYNSNQNTTIFNVAKSDSNLIISVEDIVYGENAIINIKLQNNITGNVTITINNRNYTVAIKDGVGSIRIANLTAGKYDVIANYLGDTNYSPSENVTSFNVNKLESVIVVNVDDIFVGDDATIIVKVSGDATGIVTITVNNNQYNVTLDNGTGILKLSNLTSGEYNISAKYLGDTNYLPSENTTTFNVSKLDSSVNVTVDDIFVGDDAVIYIVVSDGATGNVTVVVNGKSYVVNLTDGRATLKVGGLDSGTYVISATYDGDGKYLASSNNTSFVVSKLDSSVNVTVDDIFVGDDAVIVADFGVDISGNVTFVVDGVSYVAVIEDGAAKVNVPGLSSGSYVVSVIFQGNEKYNPTNSTSVFNVAKLNSNVNITVDDIFVDENATIIVKVSGDATGIVTITVNNNQYNVTLDNGTGVLKLSNLTSGEYNVSANYLGDDKYLPSENTTTFKVNKLDTPISIDIENKNDSTIIKITVPNDASGNITFKVNGKTYTAKIINGTATIVIRGLNNGTYNVSAIYLGDNKYLANSTNKTFTITKNNLTEENKTNTVDNQIDIVDNMSHNSNVDYLEINIITTDYENNDKIDLEYSETTGNPLFILLMALIMLIPLKKRE